jgi:hypothetical protein
MRKQFKILTNKKAFIVFAKTLQRLENQTVNSMSNPELTKIKGVYEANFTNFG